MKEPRTSKKSNPATSSNHELKYGENIDPDDLDHALVSDSLEITSQLQDVLEQAQEKHVSHERDNPAWELASQSLISEKNFILSRKSPEDDRLEEAVGLAAMKGKRKLMEDAHLATIVDLKYNGQYMQIPLIAIFDGHGGPACANFAREHLPKYFFQNLPIAFDMYDDNDTAIFNCLIFTCNQLNDEFDLDTSGTTANITAIIDHNLWVANLGDTRAILCQITQKPIVLSEDARIDELETEEEIINRGGRVIAGRVEGQIQVASALGDKGIVGISHRPKISKYTLPEDLTNIRLIIACDGLWDVASSTQVSRDVIRLGQKPLKQIANYLVHKAYKAGSQDNISVFIVDLSKLPPFLLKKTGAKKLNP